MQSVRIGEGYVYLHAPTDKLDKDLKKAAYLNRKAMKQLGQDVKAGVTASIATMSGAVAAATGYMIKTGAAYEQTLKTAAGAMRATRAEYALLDKAARQSGATTEKTAKESAEALRFLGMAGLNAATAIKALPGVIDLSTVATIELGRAADISTNIMSAFGLGVKDLAHINDVLVATATRSNNTIETLAQAFKYAAPVAKQLKIGLEETSAMLGILASSGVAASDAGTDLTQAFLRNIEVAKAMGTSGSDLVGTLEAVKKAGWDNTQIVKAYGLESFKSIGIIMDNADAIRTLTGEIKNSDGEMQALAATMRNTTSGAFKELASVIESIALDAFDVYGDKIKRTVQETTGLIRDHKSDFFSLFEFINSESETFVVFFNRVWIEAQRIVKTAISAMLDLFLDLQSAWGKISTEISKVFKTAFAGMRAALGGIIKEIQTDMADMLMSVGKAAQAIGKNEFASGAFKMSGELRKAANNAETFAEAIARIEKESQKQLDIIKEQTDARRNQLKQELGLVNIQKDYAKALDINKRVARSFDEIVPPIAEVVEETEELNKATETADTTINALDTSIQNATKSTSNLREEMDRLAAESMAKLNYQAGEFGEAEIDLDRRTREEINQQSKESAEAKADIEVMEYSKGLDEMRGLAGDFFQDVAQGQIDSWDSAIGWVESRFQSALTNMANQAMDKGIGDLFSKSGSGSGGSGGGGSGAAAGMGALGWVAAAIGAQMIMSDKTDLQVRHSGQNYQVGDATTGHMFHDPWVEYGRQEGGLGAGHQAYFSSAVKEGDWDLMNKSFMPTMASWADPIGQSISWAVSDYLGKELFGTTLTSALFKDKEQEFTLDEAQGRFDQGVKGYQQGQGLGMVNYVNTGDHWHSGIIEALSGAYDDISNQFNERVIMALGEIPDEYDAVFEQTLEGMTYGISLGGRWMRSEANQAIQEKAKEYGDRLNQNLMLATARTLKAYIANAEGLEGVLSQSAAQGIAHQQVTDEAGNVDELASARAAMMEYQQVVKYWSDIDENLEALSTEGLSDFEKRMQELNKAFADQVNTSRQLGITEQAITELREKQNTALEYQTELFEAQRQSQLDDIQAGLQKLSITEQIRTETNNQFEEIKKQQINLGATQQDLQAIELLRLETVKYKLGEVSSAITANLDNVRSQIERMQFMAGGGTSAGYQLSTVESILSGAQGQTMEGLQQASQALSQWFSEASSQAGSQTAASQQVVSSSQAASDGWLKVTEKALSLADSFNKLLIDLEASSLNPAGTGEQYQQMAARYSSLLEAAKGGGEKELTTFRDYAKTFLGQSQQRFGSQLGYSQDYDRVTGDLRGLAGGLTAGNYDKALAAGLTGGGATGAGAVIPSGSAAGTSLSDLKKTFDKYAGLIEQQLTAVENREMLLTVSGSGDTQATIDMLSEITKAQGWETTFDFAPDMRSLGVSWDQINQVLASNGISKDHRAAIELSFSMDLSGAQAALSNFMTSAEQTASFAGGMITKTAEGLAWQSATGAITDGTLSAIAASGEADLSGFDLVGQMAAKYNIDRASIEAGSGWKPLINETDRTFAEDWLKSTYGGAISYQEWVDDQVKLAQFHGIPGYKTGGIASGPDSGYLAILHGKEQITPIGDMTAGDKAIVEALYNNQSRPIALTVNLDGKPVMDMVNNFYAEQSARSNTDGRRVL